MKRRDFLITSAIGGSVAAMTGVASCTSQPKTGNRPGSLIPEFDLSETTIASLQEKMAVGQLTAKEICRKYLDRIAAVDPLLQAVIGLNPDAVDMAGTLDEERKSGKVRGLLHGIPVLIKDNIDTGDKMQTTAGSLALEGNLSPMDAPVVAKLREAGAVILGKTNLSEWANFRSEMSSSGWSGRGGQVRNPWCLDRSPCGSSSGSAVAVSANLCAVAIGTETNGSIVCPSGVNGVVGIKPTLGLWSRRGIIPIAHSQDTAGPMCRSVTDAAILLGALAGFDDDDADTHVPRGPVFNDYTRFLDPDGLKGSRIGVAAEMTGFHPLVDQLFNQAIEAIKNLGGEIIPGLKFKNRREAGDHSYQVLLFEFKADLNNYLSAHPGAKVRSLQEIIAFNDANASREMPWFGQDIFLLAQAKEDLSSDEYKTALLNSKRLMQEEGIDRLMEQHRLDAIIAPTNGPAWTIDWINGDHFSGSSSSPAAIAGYPNMTIPMGFVQGLPVGISFFGKAWSEPVLLRLGYAFEQATRHRKAPAFLPSVVKHG